MGTSFKLKIFAELHTLQTIALNFNLFSVCTTYIVAAVSSSSLYNSNFKTQTSPPSQVERKDVAMFWGTKDNE